MKGGRGKELTKEIELVFMKQRDRASIIKRFMANTMPIHYKDHTEALVWHIGPVETNI